MAKVKTTKTATNSQNKPSSKRLDFLYQAATLLAEEYSKLPQTSPTIDNNVTGTSNETPQALQVLSRRLATDLRSVSRKTQTRLAPTVKHSICKGCNTVLLEGSTCSKEIENRSRGGRKPWADVHVLRCNSCGLAKRFPVGAKRQERRPHRGQDGQVAEDPASSNGG